jgi:hypothetical protein
MCVCAYVRMSVCMHMCERATLCTCVYSRAGIVDVYVRRLTCLQLPFHLPARTPASQQPQHQQQNNKKHLRTAQRDSNPGPAKISASPRVGPLLCTIGGGIG